LSNLGVASVVAITLSGLVNTWFLTDRFERLIGTEYGRLLQIKLILFAAMLVVAAINRTRLLAVLSSATNDKRGPMTLRRLRGNAAIEIVLGLAVICIVGLLGVTEPAGHRH
jgi:putative copper resistance protein D